MTGVDTQIVYLEPEDTEEARPIRSSSGIGDVIFRGIARSAGAIVLVIMALVGVFLGLPGAAGPA